jgi:ABC-2 type transport system ATP-binding protein
VELLTPVRALDVHGVTKVFGPGRVTRLMKGKRADQPHRAVDRVSFSITPGEIFGVIGANGSGKSTLIRIISTLLVPDEGEVLVFGQDVVSASLEVRALLNRVSVDPSFFRNMSALENLLFFGRAYGLTGREVRDRSEELLSGLGLKAKTMREPMQHLSRGQQQKVAVARAFLTRPRLMLLDEPTTGLDPRSKRDVQRFVLDARERDGVAILLTTHDMAEAEALCDRLAFLADGRIVAEGTPLELRKATADGRPLDTVDMETVFIELTGRTLEDDEEGDRMEREQQCQ